MRRLDTLCVELATGKRAGGKVIAAEFYKAEAADYSLTVGNESQEKAYLGVMLYE